MSKQSAKTSAGDLFARKGNARPAGNLIAYERIPPNQETPGDETPDPAAKPGEAAADENSTMAGSLLSIEFRKQASENEIHGLQGGSGPSPGDVLGSPASMQRKISSSFQNPERERRKPLRFSTPTDCVTGTAEASRPAPMLPHKPRQETSRVGTMLAVAAGCCLIVGAWFVLQYRGGTTPEVLETAAPEAESAAVPEAESVADAPAEQADPAESASAAEPNSTPEPNFDLIRVEPDGEAVIAGRAAPNAELILLDNGEPIGTVTANWAGEWAFIPDKPLKPGNHQFSLVVKEPQGTVTLPAPEEEAGAVQPQRGDDSAVEPGAAESPEAAAATPDTGSGDAAPVSDRESSSPDSQSDRQSSIPPQDPPVPPHKPTLKDTAALGGDGPAHYMIQLSSTHSRTGAQKEWVKLTRIFPNLLDGMELNVHEATVDPLGTRYRVRTGLFADQDHAQALCQKFQSLDQECLVIKR